MRRYAQIALLVFLVPIFSFSASAQGGNLNIVASFSILGDVVEFIAGVGFTDLNNSVTTLIPPGVDPHSYQPSARDIAALDEADVIFVAGGGFEGPLLDLIQSAAPDTPIIEASACVPMRPYSGAPDAAHDGTHDDEGAQHIDAVGIDLVAFCASGQDSLRQWLLRRVDREPFPAKPLPVYDDTLGPLYQAGCRGDGGADDGHEHGVCDPHVWSDPQNVYYWSIYIAEVLSAIDPVRANNYGANGQDYLGALTTLISQNQAKIDAIPPENRVLVTTHDTLGYFAAAYGFEVVGFVMPGGSSLAEPSAQDLAALIDRVREYNVPAVFNEASLLSEAAVQVAREAGAKFEILYTDSLSPDGYEAATYLGYINYNFAVIATALTPDE